MATIILVSCGKPLNKRQTEANLLMLQNQTLIESSCAKNDTRSELYFNVVNLVNTIKFSNVTMFGMYFSKIYTYSQPLEVNELIIRKMYLDLETQYRSGSVSFTLLNDIIEYLNRFEALKCQANNLSKKMDKDLRPYMYFLQKCNLKNESDCSVKILEEIINSDKNTSFKNIQNLCLAFNRPLICSEYLKSIVKENQTPKYTFELLNRFKKEKIETLFSLKSSSPKLDCTQVNDKTKLNLKIFNGGFDNYLFAIVKDSIIKTWSRNDVEFDLIEVINASEANVKIVPLNNELSHVKDNDLSTIYLDKNLNDISIGRVAAHEFGHTLGFPDCYIEFYDPTSVSLIYYEFSENNQNIMCSLRDGVFVQDDYLEQIKAKTCNFK